MHCIRHPPERLHGTEGEWRSSRAAVAVVRNGVTAQKVAPQNIAASRIRGRGRGAAVALHVDHGHMRREMLCARTRAEQQQQQQLATSKRLGWGRRTLKFGISVVNWSRSLLLKRRRWAVAILVTCPHIVGLGILLAPGAPHCSSVGVLRTQPPSPSSPLLGRPAPPFAQPARAALAVGAVYHRRMWPRAPSACETNGTVEVMSARKRCRSPTLLAAPPHAERRGVVPPPLRAARPPPTP